MVADPNFAYAELTICTQSLRACHEKVPNEFENGKVNLAPHFEWKVKAFLSFDQTFS